MRENKQHSALYQGWVQHRRAAPKHDFKYPIFMAYLDLDEVGEVFAQHPLWSRERWNAVSFRRSDYMSGEQDLRDTVRKRIARDGIEPPRGAVRMLTHLRYFGYCFNPVTFYFCFNTDGRLEVIVAEITNTPWDERFSYVLDVRQVEPQGKSYTFDFQKDFHVSPFLDMHYRYRWTFTDPSEHLVVHMKNLDGDHVDFDATLSLEHRAMSRANMGAIITAYPLMTLKVVAGIYWQAFLLWSKRARFFTHPSKRSLQEQRHARKSE